MWQTFAQTADDEHASPAWNRGRVVRRCPPLIVLLHVYSARGFSHALLNTVLYSDGHVVLTAGGTDNPPWLAHQRDFLARKLSHDDLAALLDELKLEELRKLNSYYVCPNPNGPWKTFPDGRVVHFTGPADHDPVWRLLVREDDGYRAISLAGPSGCEPEVFQHAFARLKDFNASPWSPDTLEVVLFPDTSNESHDAVAWPRNWPTPAEFAKGNTAGVKVVRVPATDVERARSLLGSDGEARWGTLPNGEHWWARWRWPLPDEQSWQQ